MTLPIVTFTTDFGYRDGYVASMKGVALGICPSATLIDISHDIPAHDIPHGAFVLGVSSGYFPVGTIHVAVVDPGVGSARHPVMLVTPRYYYIAPDNGILSYVLLAGSPIQPGQREDWGAADRFMSPVRMAVPPDCRAYILNKTEFWLPETSNTFHGRDVFTPVAAHLASGRVPDSLGEPVQEVTCLDIPAPYRGGSIISGRVIFVDVFGNLVTNIRLSDDETRQAQVKIAGRTIHGMSLSYQQSALPLLATIGGHGNLEIAVRRGSAHETLGVGVGEQVAVRLLDES
jgi:hypothetical protein